MEAEDSFFQEASSKAWQDQARRAKGILKFGKTEFGDGTEARMQFQQGLKMESLGEPKKAVKDYRKALVYSPVYPLAAELLWHLGKCDEKLFRWQEAFDSYQSLYKDFPGYENADAALDRQLQIALAVASKEKKFELTATADQTREEIAVDMLDKLAKLVPKSQLAGVCQFETGKIYKNAKKYRKASDAYYQVVLSDPTHALCSEALYESGMCASVLVRKADYDEKLIEQVASRLNRFAEENPNDPRLPQVKEVCARMNEMKAEKLFETGKYYQNTGSKTAAKIYFAQVMEAYPGTSWAGRAGTFLAVDKKKELR